MIYIYHLFPPPFPALSITPASSSSQFYPSQPHQPPSSQTPDQSQPGQNERALRSPNPNPERLYRVQHDKSFTKDVEEGLVAADMQTFTEDTYEFAIALENHINGFKEEGRSMFISTFASKAQAEDWMCRNWRLYGEGAQILEIETCHLGHGYVYRAGEVAHTLEVDTSETTYKDLHNEYLILHFVPARAIIARRARMITHDLDNNSDPMGTPVSTGSNNSYATMEASQSPPLLPAAGQPSSAHRRLKTQDRAKFVRSARIRESYPSSRPSNSGQAP